MQLGIYEKCLPENLSWSAKLARTGDSGFQFIEMAIDESLGLLGRLDWTVSERIELANAVLNSGIPVYGMILSAHRKYAFGSSSSQTRQKAAEILKKAIDLAFDIGVRVIQIAGYYVFYEEASSRAEEWFLEGLNRGVELAAQAGIMLGLENMDGHDITSVAKARRIVDSVNSPWLQLYPDLGNLSANGLDIGAELKAGEGHLVGVHLKDTRPGEFRRVAFGEGTVPFTQAFQVLKQMNYRGPFVIEMWNTGWSDPDKVLAESRGFVLECMAQAGLIQLKV